MSCFSEYCSLFLSVFFFFNDTATTEIYTLSLHDALPICGRARRPQHRAPVQHRAPGRRRPRGVRRGLGDRRAAGGRPDRKSTRLNSSHITISYAVFCLKKKKTTITKYDFIKNISTELSNS